MTDKRGNVARHEVIAKEDVSRPGEQRYAIRVVVKETVLPSKLDMERLAEHLMREERGKWTAISVFVYMDGMDAYHCAYGVVPFVHDVMQDIMLMPSALEGTPWEGQTPP